MNKKYKNIFFSIAGFIVKIVLYESKNKSLSQEYGKKILHMFRYFLVKEAQRPNLSILFQDSKYIVQVNQLTIDDGIFIQIARKKNQNIYITSYTISTSQLFFLINKLIFEHIAKKDCFTFHTSAVYVKNTAYLFSGDSTAGKSTIIKLIKDNHISPLCDDYGFIRKIDDMFYFYPPGPLERLHHPSPNTKYIIGGIYLIKKSQHFRIQKIDYTKNSDKLFSFFKRQITLPQTAKKGLLIDFLSKYQDRIFSLEFEKKKFKEDQKKMFVPVNE